MEFVKALKEGDESIINCFHRIDCLFQDQGARYKSITESVEQKYLTLLCDEKNDKSEFLVPDLAKYRKDVKGKRTSRVKKKTSNAITRNSSYQSADRIPETNSVNTSQSSVDSCDIIRKSSRLASKMSQVVKQEIQVVVPSLPDNKYMSNETFVTKSTTSKVFPLIEAIVPNQSIEKEAKRKSSRLADKNIDTNQNGTKSTSTSVETNGDVSEPPSPSLPPMKIRCIENVNSKELSISRRFLDTSTCPSEMKEPLGSSTPTNSLLESVKKSNLHESPLNLTPKYLDTAKKMKMKTNIYTEQSLSAIKGPRRTRNQDKILQEKNTNVKLIEEKCQEAQKKKEVIMKSSAEEAKRKREERTRKAAALREAALQEKMKQARKQEKEKEMKLKTIEKQKDEKLRIEMQKKKHLAAMKQAEIEKRKKEEAEAAKSHKTKNHEAKSDVVEYAIDHVLHGASSDEEDCPKNKVPSWATKENRRQPLMIQAWLDRKELVRPWFFNPSLKYPKLEVLFPGVNLKSRPRASSALWNTIVDFDEAFPLHD